MTKSYPIKIWSGLLLNGHTQKIENALWEFIWLVNKVTKEEDGVGYVLRGTPIKVEDICVDLKRKYQSVYRHLQQLKKNGYINMKKAPYGLIITVNNSKKFADGLIKNDKAGLIKNDTRLIKYDNGLIKNDKANKILKDNKDNNIYPVFDFWNSKEELITHRELSKIFKTKITKLLKNYSLDEIKTAIANYCKILASDKYWLSYRWTIAEFIDRGFEKLKDWKIAEESYKSKEIKNAKYEQTIFKKYRTV